MSDISALAPPAPHARRNSPSGWTVSQRRRQTGLTAVELMVAAVVSLILLGGIVQIFISNKQAYRVQDQLGLLQENGRYAAETLARSLRVADHWGGVEAGAVRGNPTVNGPGSCNQAWINNVAMGVQGFEGASAIGGVTGLPSGCVASADYVPNSDIVVIRYADPDNPVTDANLTAAGNSTRPFVRAAVGLKAQLMRGSDTLPADIPTQAGTYNFPYAVEAYFVRPCSNKAGAACAASDDGGNPIPSLVRLAFSGNTVQQEVLAEGIEQLQIRYGADVDNDGDADRYDSASGISTAAATTPNWGQVVSAEFSLIARGSQEDPIYTDGNTYAMVGYSHTPASAVRSFHRKQYTRVIQMRNRTRQ